MKKIILSVAVAAMALTTTASALEDIKVNGSAKVWYETWNKGETDIFKDEANSQAEVVFQLGMTGKQGNVGFGAEVTQGSTMGLENVLVGGTRSAAVNQDMFVSKAYFTAPVAPDTIIKMGRQELNTPLAFTEKWNAIQNNFNAAVFVNSSVSDLTIIGAFVGQGNAQQDVGAATSVAAWKAGANFNQLHGGAYALAALYDNKSMAVNFWGYQLNELNLAPADATTANALAGINAQAIWLDAGMKFGDASVKAYAAYITSGNEAITDDTTAVAVSAAYKVSGWTLSGAASSVGEDGFVPVANVATNFKKTKLPTAGVYTDGLYVAQLGSTAVKLKAAGKVGSTGLVVQAVTNANDIDVTKETTEIDVIVSQKLGDFNLKGILMNRSFEDTATDDASGGQHVRVIASVKF